MSYQATFFRNFRKKFLQHLDMRKTGMKIIILKCVLDQLAQFYIEKDADLLLKKS